MSKGIIVRVEGARLGLRGIILRAEDAPLEGPESPIRRAVGAPLGHHLKV